MVALFLMIDPHEEAAAARIIKLLRFSDIRPCFKQGLAQGGHDARAVRTAQRQDVAFGVRRERCHTQESVSE